MISCDFTSFTRVPFGLPATVTSLSMFSSAVKSVTFSSFTTPFILNDIINLNLRNNVITNVDGAAFYVLTRLETLNLAENQIASLDEEVFGSLTALKVLNLRIEDYPEPPPEEAIDGKI